MLTNCVRGVDVLGSDSPADKAAAADVAAKAATDAMAADPGNPDKVKAAMQAAYDASEAHRIADQVASIKPMPAPASTPAPSTPAPKKKAAPSTSSLSPSPSTPSALVPSGSPLDRIKEVVSNVEPWQAALAGVGVLAIGTGIVLAVRK